MLSNLKMKYTYLFSLIILTFAACKSPQQKAYNALLSQGTVLVEGDTVSGKVGNKFLYIYNFSAGVEDIHYKLTYINSDPSVVQYEGNEEFYLGAQDVDGGPSSGIHIFKGLKEGLVKIEFYNPYYNEQNYKNEAEQNLIIEAKLIQEVCNALGLPIGDTTCNLQTLQQAKLASLTNQDPVFLETVLDSLIKSHATTHYYNEVIKSVLDSIYAIEWINQSEQWEAEKAQVAMMTTLHKNTNLTTCYVKVTEE